MTEKLPNDDLSHQPMQSQAKVITSQLTDQIFNRSNLPIIFLISGVVLVLFFISATAGLVGYALLNRPTASDKIAEIDLSSYSSTVPVAVTANGTAEVVPGSAPGLYKIETDKTAEIQEISPAGRVLPGGQTFTSLSILPELPTSYYENRLSQNLADNPVPALSHDGGENRGPQRVQFIVSENGNLHDHTLGKATFADTEIVGAAGEWQVRPWWQPAWVPQSVDCGEEGTVAIGGHVSWASRPGPFHDLGAMTAGDRIRCQSTTGAWHTYEVSEVVQVGYNDTDYYWSTRSNLNDHQLTLFSCKPEITGIIVVRAQIIKG
ncbi:MAG: class F sortase [Anaerolineae bacterium]